MSPQESMAMEAMRQEILDEILKSRDELATSKEVADLREAVADVREAVAPAIALAAKLDLAGSILIGTARVVKFGLGLGAAVMVIVGGFVAIGWIHP